MAPINSSLRNQYGGELYWKLLLTPDLWITPGLQFIVDPSLNPQEDFVAIAQLKLRLFL
jgi:carbohydrate-selective porin OprB